MSPPFNVFNGVCILNGESNHKTVTMPDVDVVEEESQRYNRLEATVHLGSQPGKHD